MKIKIVDSFFDPKSGHSYVEISTGRYGNFWGEAWVHPDEPGPHSRYFGCNLAELRATISLMKEMRKEARLKKKTLMDFYKSVEGMVDFDPSQTMAIKLRKAIQAENIEITNLSKSIDNFESSIKTSIRLRDNTIKGQNKTKN